jgi:hypothetical protein
VPSVATVICEITIRPSIAALSAGGSLLPQQYELIIGAVNSVNGLPWNQQRQIHGKVSSTSTLVPSARSNNNINHSPFIIYGNNFTVGS